MKQEKNSGHDTEEAICKTLYIEGRFYKDNCLPGLNDLLHEATRHPQAYARLKKQMETIVTLEARKQLRDYKATSRVQFDIVWGEKLKGQKRDYDNIVAAGRKIINDALVKAGYIKDDKPEYLGFGENIFMYTEVPFVKVTIKPI